MSITAYTGLPGSGKSYTVVQDVILPAIKEGRTVYTNVPLHDEVWISEFGSAPVFFETRDAMDNQNWFSEVFPSGALLVLDECWRIWPSGLKANNVNADHKTFLAEHRHRVGEDGRSTEIVLVTQDCGQLSAFVRQLIEKTFRCKKLDTVGQTNRYRLDIYEGAVTGANPPMDRRVREIYGEYKPEVYRFYKSHTKSETGGAGDETKTDQRANILKGGKARAILISALLLPIFSGFLWYRLYQKYYGHHDASVSVQAPAGVGAVVRAPVKKEPDGFLHGRRVYIVSNRRDGDAIDFRFRVADGDGYSVVDGVALVRLGYTVQAVDDCLAVIRGRGDELYAQCRDADYQSPIVSTFTPKTQL